MDRRSSSSPRAVQGREGLHDRVWLLRLPTSRDVGAPALAPLPTSCEDHLGRESKAGGGGAHEAPGVARRSAQVRECDVSPFRRQGAEIGSTASSCLQNDHCGRTVLRRGRSFPNRPGWRSRRIPSRSTESREDRKSTRLNSSHVSISYAVFCLKK